MANSNRESGEIARRPYPTTLKGLLVEISIEATVFSSILIIGGFLFGDPDFFDGDHIEKILGLGHLIITFIFFLIVPPLYKLWNYTILLILIRMTVKKYLTKFSMIRNICIVGVLWPLCFWIFFMMVFITDYEESLDLFLVSLKEFDFGVAFFPATGMFAACLGSKPNQGIDPKRQIRFTAFNQEIGGVDGSPVLAFGHPVGGDRAAFAQEPARCPTC